MARQYRSLKRSLSIALITPLFFACSEGGDGEVSQQGGEKGSKGERIQQRDGGSGQGRASGGRGAPQQGQGAPQQGPGGQPPQGAGPQGQQQAMNIEVEDEELKLFHEITKELEPLHKEFQERQRKQIEEAEMEEQRFREIAQAMRSRQDPQMSASEEKEFQELREGAKEMQQELRQKLMGKIEEKEGIDRQRFQKIASAVERDPSLQKKLDELEGEASSE